jgi:Polyketide cyclase / dehydrase and lipid transport
MNFHLEERAPGWAQQAPIQIHHQLHLPASPERVFEVLADSPGWTTWFKGMRRVRIDHLGTGVGTLRTVWVQATRVQEHFTVWEPNRQITFHIVESNSPGLKVMVEDYQIAPATNGSTLAITVGIEAQWPLRLVPGLVRMIVGRLTGGVLGISSMFP